MLSREGWRDVDLGAATLQVVRGLHDLPGKGVVFLEPKTKKGRRLVTLSPNTVLALKAHRERREAVHSEFCKEVDGSTLLFCQPEDARPFSPSTVSKAFKRIASSVGLDDVHLHLLRHSHASLLLQQGVHLRVVQERLGHSTIAVTGDIYSHVAPSLQEEAAAKFDRVLAMPSPERAVS